MYIEGISVYSRYVISIAVLGLVVSLGVVYGVAMTEAEKPTLQIELFTPSAILDLNFSTYLGGSDYDNVGDIALDSNGDIYIVGSTDSTNLPTTEDAYAKSHNGGNYWEFLDVLLEHELHSIFDKHSRPAHNQRFRHHFRNLGM